MAEKKEDLVSFKEMGITNEFLEGEDTSAYDSMEYTEGMIIALEHLASRGLSVFSISWSENDTFKRVRGVMVVENMSFEVECLDGKGYTNSFYITVNILTGEEVEFISNY